MSLPEQSCEAALLVIFGQSFRVQPASIYSRSFKFG
jgi:hypothetical protein